MPKHVAIALILAGFLAGGCSAGTGTRGWEWANPRPVGEDLAAVAFGEGRFVAVGLHGNIATSRDGEHWESASVETDALLSGVAFGNGRFVAVGTTWPDTPPARESEKTPPEPVPVPQVVYTSRSGQHWERGTTGAPGRLSGVAFGEGRFVAVGNNGIFTSTNGDDWEEVSHPSLSLQSVAYGGGRFVTVGRGGALISEDGVQWTPLTKEAGLDWRAELVAVTYGQDQFVTVAAGGYIWTSADGMTWTMRKTVPMMLGAVAYGQGRFLAVSGRAFVTSTDGVNWEISQTSLPAPVLSLAVGEDSVVAVGRGGAILHSRDGLTWAEQSPALLTDFRSAAHGADRYVAVGHRLAMPIGNPDQPNRPSVAVSDDGLSWAPAESPVPGDLEAVVYGNDAFVATGRSIYTSSDGERWEKTQEETGDRITALAFGGGRFVALRPTPGTVYTSTDGRAWEQVELGYENEIRSMVWGNGRFVGVGADQVGVVSTDGRTWTRVPMPASDLSDVAFGQDRFVAIGNGQVFSSSDGVAWTAHENSPETLLRITYGDGWFVALGPRGTVYASGDGTSWTRIPRLTVRPMNDIAFAGGRFMLLGEGAIITRKQWEE